LSKIVSRWLFTTQNKSKQHSAEEKTDEHNYFKRHTQTSLSFTFFFSYLPLNCCHTLFFLNAFSLHLCNLEMFLKTSVERKMRKQYKDVIL